MQTKRFTPKPPEIEAWQLTKENWDEALALFKRKCVRVEYDKRGGVIWFWLYSRSSITGTVHLGDWVEVEPHEQFRVYSDYSIANDWVTAQETLRKGV